MIESARQFKYYFKDLYDSNRSIIKENIDFDRIFQSNKSRMQFVNFLFDQHKMGNLTYEGESAFMSTIEYIVSFINGKLKEADLSVPKKYFDDSSMGTIIPTMKEVEHLLRVISYNSYMYSNVYDNNPLYVKLPDETFNQNMTRILEIKRKNIAHLLGLTEYEAPGELNPNKNLLKKHFNSIVKDKTKYYGDTDSEKLLSWITSIEGKEELLRVHKLTLEFINKDRKEHPEAYDGLKLKSNESSLAKFKERYKAHTGLDFPIINYSRLITKSINSLNFFKLNNVVEIILDYNAPKGKKNEKDVFLVNRNPQKINNVNKKFVNQKINLLFDLCSYAFNPNNIELKNKLLEEGINVNSSIIIDQLNMIRTNNYIGENGINPNSSIFDQKILDAINEQFLRDIHLVGFGTDFNNDNEIPLDEKSTNYTHCDTAISLTVPELLGHYYKYGRTFFLDQIESKQGILMVSNVNDEIYYLKRMAGIKLNSEEECKELVALKNKLNKNYKNYISQRR